MPLQLDHLAQTQGLLQAFHAGVVVVIDELNTILVEETLNSLFMGVDLRGEPARWPGFAVFATQNSVGIAGRLPLSAALRCRVQGHILSDYPLEELNLVFRAYGLNEESIQKLKETDEPPDTTREWIQKIPDAFVEQRVVAYLGVTQDVEDSADDDTPRDAFCV